MYIYIHTYICAHTHVRTVQNIEADVPQKKKIPFAIPFGDPIQPKSPAFLGFYPRMTSWKSYWARSC